VTDDTFRQPQLLCLDFDGTLVDTQPMWEATYLAVAASRQHQLPQHWWGMIAGKSMDASAIVFDVHDPDEQQLVAQQLVATAQTLAATFPPIVLPGATQLFERARMPGVPICIVTSTWTALAYTLAKAAGFPDVAITGGEQVQSGKPDPEIYLRACAAHHSAPKACVAVEDSPSGVTAALAAGMHVYALGEHAVTDPARQRSITTLDAIMFATPKIRRT